MDTKTTEADTLESFVARGWNDHADDAEGVWRRLPDAIALVRDAKQLPVLCGLVVHVSGEHLARFDDGLAYLARLESLPAFDAASPEGKSVLRSKAVLHLGAGRRAEARRLDEASYAGGGVPPASNRIRILATAASALANLGRLAEARALFDEAIGLAAYGPTASDPAARSLAVTGNNLAALLESKPRRSPEEATLMVRAAEAGLRFWSIAGGASETALAHYRLARSLAHAGQAARAAKHASNCIEVATQANDAFATFSGHEALAWARHTARDADAARRARDDAEAALARIDDEGSRATAKADLDALDAALA
jgi:hypothetical protein